MQRIVKKSLFYAVICTVIFGLSFIYINQLADPLENRLPVSSIKPMNRSFPCPKDNMVILTIDGGGSRGVIPLAFLEQLESVSGQNTAQLFDLMAGVSTGSIITSALAVSIDGENAKYSASTLLSLYVHDAKIIFNENFWHKLKTFWGLTGPWLNAQGKNEILNNYFSSLTLADLSSNVVIFSYDLLHAKIRMFCNWSVCDDLSNSYLISSFVSGATSIPAVFSPVILYNNNHQKIQILSDLSLMINNPAYLSYRISEKICPKIKHYIIVSLGTGLYPLMNSNSLDENSGAIVWLPNILSASVEMSSEIINNYMFSIMSSQQSSLKNNQLPKLIYLRFNPTILWDNKNPMDSSQETLKKLATKGSLVFSTNKKLIQCVANIKREKVISEYCSIQLLKYLREQQRRVSDENNLPVVIDN